MKRIVSYRRRVEAGYFRSDNDGLLCACESEHESCMCRDCCLLKLHSEADDLTSTDPWVRGKDWAAVYIVGDRVQVEVLFLLP